MSQPLLEARRLTKFYAGLPAVDHVSFSIGPGEVFGYLGPNGSGKSTTVKMITGLLEPSEGEILYHGADIQSDLEAYKRQVGYVPEESSLYPFLSGWEYIELVATLRGLPARVWQPRAAALLEHFLLSKSRHTPLSAYSKGMRQRIMLIAALLHDPEILILDEPFSGLDVTSVLVLRRVLQLLAARGKAILFCSPVLELVEKVCTHLLVLRRGQTVACGPIAQIRPSLDTALEQRFLELTEENDASQLADRIVAALAA